MKQSFSLILMIALFVFSSTVFAGDGSMGSPGKSCPNGATTCLVANSDIPEDTEYSQKAWYQELFDFIF